MLQAITTNTQKQEEKEGFMGGKIEEGFLGGKTQKTNFFFF